MTYNESYFSSEPKSPLQKSKYRIRLPLSKERFNTEEILRSFQLNTVCEEAKCPNRMECFSKKTATFLALGKECTRNCGFCDIDFSKSPKPLSSDEPDRIAESIKLLGLEHVVITMVARDDLEDGGALQIVKITNMIRKLTPNVTIELLTSDFQGNCEALDLVFSAKPDVFNYNIETVKRLTAKVRHKATYERTLQVLKRAKSSQLMTKSGMMLGLGETKEEIIETLLDLKEVGCDMVTIGQYLQPSRKKLPVKRLYSPEEFLEIRTLGLELGLKQIYSGPFVRSSYNAKEFIDHGRK